MFLYSWIIDSLKLQFYKGTVVPPKELPKELSFLSESIPYKKTAGFLSALLKRNRPVWRDKK